MTHIKLLRQRLACVSWLLAAGLVLGWSGKAAAQDVNISLAVNPTAISEDADATDVVVTATLDGGVLDHDVVVLLVINNESTAIRDVDYDVDYRAIITIPAGSVSGTTTITITAINDKRVEGDETIRLAWLTWLYDNNTVGTYDNNMVGTVDITLKDAGLRLSFDEDAAIYDQIYIVGTAVAALVLPEASGGTGELTYSISALPTGLSFDAATRTLSGTPTAAIDGAVEITYTVMDNDDDTAALTFTIIIAAPGTVPVFAADASIDDVGYTVGVPSYDLVLPEASGGTGELTYGVSALPEGLVFDAATRTLSGMPAVVTDGAVTVVYTATDESGTTNTLTFTITVNPCLCDNWELLGLSNWETGAEEPEEPENPSPTFAADAAIDDQVYTAEAAVAALVLPEASGGTGELTYSVSALPKGLSFDAATRTLSGCPSAATDGAVTVVYTATDGDGTTDTLTFTITVNPPLSFDTLLDLFGAGKIVPTASHD